MTTGTLHDLMLDALHASHSSEHQLLHALPRLATRAVRPDLIDALERWHTHTQLQVDRLVLILDALGAPGVPMSCGVTADLLAKTTSQSLGTGSADGVIAVSAREIAHQAVASYYQLLAVARRIGQMEVAAVLERSLSEDRDAWKRLTSLASERRASLRQ